MMDIKDIIKQQYEALSELNILLDCEKEILIKDKASELSELIEKKREIAKKIAGIEKTRQELYRDKKAEDFVNEGLIENSDIEKLKKLADTIKEKEEVNLVLTRQSINYIRLITSALNPNQRVVTYGNSGKIDDNTTSSLFTTRV